MTIELGQKVVDRITGFAGVATACTRYLNGCVRYLVEPVVGDDGKLVDGEWFDEQRLVEDSPVSTGGPGKTPPPLPTPNR